jgi:hypothetical protein
MSLIQTEDNPVERSEPMVPLYQTIFKICLSVNEGRLTNVDLAPDIRSLFGLISPSLHHMEEGHLIAAIEPMSQVVFPDPFTPVSQDLHCQSLLDPIPISLFQRLDQVT